MVIRGLIALAFGTLGLGIAEYVAMGLLPYIAADFSVSLAKAGQVISMYAIGVAFGTFLIIFFRLLSLKTLLIICVATQMAGTAITCFAPNFESLCVARFIAGLPHGAFFGVGSIVATRLAGVKRASSAVAIMIAGMTVANMFGVPLGTALAHSLNWRVIFFIVLFWTVLVMVSILLWVRDVGGLEDHGFRDQFKFLKFKAPWLVLIATLFGNAGIFSLISYESPILTDLAGLDLAHVAVVLVLMGIAMVVFNLVSGRLCDHYTPGKVAAWMQGLSVLVLLAISLFGSIEMLCVILMCLSAGLLFGISAPEQVSILRTASGGLLIAGASVQAAVNLGTTLGAYVDGKPFNLDLYIRNINKFGAGLALIGFLALLVYARRYEKKFNLDVGSGKVDIDHRAVEAFNQKREDKQDEKAAAQVKPEDAKDKAGAAVTEVKPDPAAQESAKV